MNCLYREQTELKESTEFIEDVEELAGSQPVERAGGEVVPAVVPAEVAAENAALLQSTEPKACAASPYTERSNGSDQEPKSKFGWLLNRGAIVSLTAASWLPIMALSFMSAHAYFLLTGVQTTAFMHATNSASALAVLVTSICSYELFRAILGTKHTKFSILRRIVLSILALWVGITNGPLGIATVLGLCLCGFAMTPLGNFIRQAIPQSFRFAKAIRLMGLVSLPSALFVAFGMDYAITHPRPTHELSTYSDTNTMAFLFMTFVLYLLLAIPTYAATRCGRTSEFKPLFTLGMLLQTPLFIGIFAQCIAIAFVPANLTMVIASVSTATIALWCIGAGAAQAAKDNGTKHKRMLAKSGA